MKNKVIVLIILVALIASVFLINKYTTNKMIDIPINAFVGEKSDIEEVEYAILTYIAESNLSKQDDVNTKVSGENIDKVINSLKDYFVGVKIVGNKAAAVLGSDISPYSTRIFNLQKTGGKWNVEKLLYFNDLPDKEKNKIFAKLNDISNKLTELNPKQVVYRFLATKLHLNEFGLATIEEESDTECRCKVPLKDERIIEFVLTRPEKTGFSIRPWQVKSYKFTKQ